MNFADRLIKQLKKKNSRGCVGLDPRLKRIPQEIKTKAKEEYGPTAEAAGQAFLEFNRGIIDAVKEYVPAVKPQRAFYEQYGAPGVKAFIETVSYAKEQGLVVIADAKRNDIGSTAEAYAAAHLGRPDFWPKEELTAEADSLTVTPYLGTDGIKPFVDVCREEGKGIFVLVRTSNPSAGEVQDLETTDGELVYEKLAHLVADWGVEVKGKTGYSSIGAVVGATYPQEAERLRKIMKDAYFLVPGYGAQGGGADDVVPCFHEDGLGAVVNSARGIIFAYEQDKYSDDYQQAAAQAAEEMKTEINRALANKK